MTHQNDIPNYDRWKSQEPPNYSKEDAIDEAVSNGFETVVEQGQEVVDDLEDIKWHVYYLVEEAMGLEGHEIQSSKLEELDEIIARVKEFFGLGD